MTKALFTASALCIGLALPAVADPLVGVGLSFSFGGGSSEAGFGVRVFSDDERDEVAASVGLDYMFQSQRVRPTVGAAYIGTDAYIGLDLGYDFNAGTFDYGLSVGGMSAADNEPAGDDTDEADGGEETGGDIEILPM